MVGKWAGEARLLRRPGEPAVLAQTEEARYKLGGLILEIEGIGRSQRDNKPVLEALGLISFELAEITIDSQPARQLLEVTVKRLG